MNKFFRTRCLLLTLVLAFGLLGTAQAKDFTDNSNINYGEATEVMTGIGAMNGYTDGTIKPTATITRE